MTDAASACRIRAEGGCMTKPYREERKPQTATTERFTACLRTVRRWNGSDEPFAGCGKSKEAEPVWAERKE